MKERKLLAASCICVLLLVISIIQAVFILLMRDDIQQYEAQLDISQKYRSFVLKAEQIHASELQVSLQRSRVGRRPVVIDLGSDVCVSLQMMADSVGGNPAYCFSKTNMVLLRAFKGEE
jgi:thiol:disulfide interchange protein